MFIQLEAELKIVADHQMVYIIADDEEIYGISYSSVRKQYWIIHESTEANDWYATLPAGLATAVKRGICFVYISANAARKSKSMNKIIREMNQ